jgi:tetratricopeptide (TPR) repeat protein
MDSRIRELLSLARDHYRNKEFDKADDLLREVLPHTEGFADVHDMLGVIAHSRGHLLQAADYFERAVRINPSYTEALLNLAVTYNDLGRYEAAQQMQAKANTLRAQGPLKLDPFAKGKIANMHADVGLAYAESGMLDNAIEELQKAVQLCPGFADLRTRLGTLYKEQGDLSRAREQFQLATESNPRYMQARVMLGLSLFALGDREAAVAEWQQVAEAEPDNRLAQMYLRMAEAHRARTEG